LLFVVTVRRVEEGKRLRDRRMWKEEKSVGRWKRDSTRKKDAEIGGHCKKNRHLASPSQYSIFKQEISLARKHADMHAM
jgi:hypothetical protein